LFMWVLLFLSLVSWFVCTVQIATSCDHERRA
jgi:hypothetical protein